MASLVATAIVYAPHKLAYLDRHRSELQMLLMGTSITEVILNGFVVASSILILRNAVLTTAQEIVVACIYVLASRYHPSPPPPPIMFAITIYSLEAYSLAHLA